MDSVGYVPGMKHAGACVAAGARVSREGIERIDAQLAQHARAEAALRLHLGQALEVLGRGACFELGFSSLSAYALERCERSVRWALAARCLAQRLEALPELRRAVAAGRVSWSKAELVAPVVLENEARWVDAAQRLTVRELRTLLQEGAGISAPSSAGASLDDGDELCTLVCTIVREEAWLFEATRALLDQLGTPGANAQLEALLAEAQITLLDGLPRGAIDFEAEERPSVAQAQWQKQLERWRAEAEARCEANIPRGHEHEMDEHEHETEEEVGRACTSRTRAEPRGSGVSNGTALLETVTRAAMFGCSLLEPRTARELDDLVRALSRALAQHELELSRLILAFHRADGWRRLGYATETQYARERLGMSRSSVLARRALAARLAPASGAGAPARAGLPLVAAALGQAHIGVEAALQLVRVATPETERAWVEHARRRTIKHLREEVAAALTAQRISGEAHCPPPEVGEIDAFQELERAASSGRVWRPSQAPANDGAPNGEAPRVTKLGDAERATEPGDEAPRVAAAQPNAGEPVAGSPFGEPASEARRAWREMLASLTDWLSGGAQTSAAAPGGVQTSAVPAVANGGVQTSAVRSAKQLRSAGRVTLRLRVSRAARAWWRGLEAQARRWLPRGMSWLRFCCLSLWRAWRHLLEPSVAYGHIYIRDRHRCTSPVCNRRDVTPHHLQFRSQGGSDDDENVAAVCTWCHLFGIHGGRIRAEGGSSHIHWELGEREEPCLVVDGRERRVA